MNRKYIYVQVFSATCGLFGAGVVSGLLTCSLATAFALGMAISAAITDVAYRKIFNWLTYPSVCIGLLLATIESSRDSTDPAPPMLADLTSHTVGGSLLGAVVCGLAALVAYACSGGGGGDVKYSCALGALLGVGDALVALSLGYILAALIIVGKSVSGRIMVYLADGPNQPSRRLGCFSISLEGVVPMGGYFAVGVLLVVTGAIR